MTEVRTSEPDDAGRSGDLLKVVAIGPSDGTMDRAKEQLEAEGFSLDWIGVHSIKSMAQVLDGEVELVIAEYTPDVFDLDGVVRRVRLLSPRAAVLIAGGADAEEVSDSLMRLGADAYMLGGGLAHLPEVARKALEHARTQHEAGAFKDRYSALFNAIPVGVFRADRAGRIVEANPALRRMLAEPEADRQRHLALADYVPQRKRNSLLRRLSRGRPVIDQTLTLARRDGLTLAVRADLSASYDPTGRVAFVQGVLTDVTEHQRAQQALRAAELNYRILFQDNPHPMWVYDLETLKFLAVNHAACAQYGYTQAEFTEMQIVDIRPREEVERLLENLEAGRPSLQLSGEWRHRRKDGSVFFVDITSHDLAYDERPAALVLALDVTARRELDEQLRHQAFHDSLTGLANRALFRNRIEQAIVRSRRHGNRCAVLLIDIDHFAAINDSAGHSYGDEALIEVARIIRSCIDESDTVARLDGDEFGVLVDEISTDEDGMAIAATVAEKVASPAQLGSRRWTITASIGMATSSDGRIEADELLRNADVALYKAKQRAPGGIGNFDPDTHSHVLERIELEFDLRQAIAGEEFRVVYQPQVDLTTGSIVAVEALVRWTHVDWGVVSPAIFIPLAEEMGLIGSIDAEVLRRALSDHHAWRTTGVQLPTIALNLSGRELQDAALTERILAAMEPTGATPSEIELEVTETAAIESTEALATLFNLREAGFQLALDDFGVGYSMLSRLQEYPFHKVKIDRSFIDRITNEGDGAPIVTGIIAMAHSLGLIVVAEGVETDFQRAFLAENRCDVAQGFGIYRPMPSSQFEALLATEANGRAPS